MKQAIIFLILFTSFQSLFSQKPVTNEFAAIDKKALQLPDSLTTNTTDIANFIKANFQTDSDKSRAIFIWVASNITYDVENMFAINYYETNADKISKPLLTRTGICGNFAALFTDICTKSGLKSFVIVGYTKQNGFADYVPHAWCAAQIDSTWFLFDPTWGSGHLSNGKLVTKINNKYYKVNPESLIKSHMPFDYLWQFLNYPVTNQEFYEGNTQLNKSKAFFNFKDSIGAYEQQSRLEQLISKSYRVEKNGVKNSLVFDQLRHIKAEIDNIQRNAMVALYNSAVKDYNSGVNSLNDFINYRNKQFIPMKPDAEIQNMLEIVIQKFDDANFKLGKIIDPDESTRISMDQLTKSINDAKVQLKDQIDWLKAYFSKNKSGRRNMFFVKKVYMFGIPIE